MDINTKDPFFRVLLHTCERVGTPRALAVKLLVEGGEWAQLSQLRVRPVDYWDSEQYFNDCLVTDFLRKCSLPSGIDRDGKARDTFISCEKMNYRTNMRLSRFLPETLLIEDSGDESVFRFIGEWRKDIAAVLRSLPGYLTPRFSSGATVSDVGELITTPDKMSGRPSVYQHSRSSILPFWEQTSWYRTVVRNVRKSDPRDVRANVFFTVPKDAKSFRGCCKEASLNVSFQLDVGRIMKDRLRDIGIDLREGQQLHRLLAKEASVTDDLATIDLSNASDTLCRNLVKLLLPEQWYELLSSLRATHTKVDHRVHRLEKFSSMGNGFTFELESLIFVTLARTLARLRSIPIDGVKCYGDDIIVPASLYKDVTSALKLFGFQPNMEKTFAEGPFRESCGGDYWRGVPVRAHHVEELPDEPQKWIGLANGLRRVCDPVAFPHRWELVRKAWMICLDQLPVLIRRCRGPSELGDIVIHDIPERWWFKSGPADDPSWENRLIHSYLPLPLVLPWKHWKPDVQLASCTLGYPSRGITPRDGVTGYRVGLTESTIQKASRWLPTGF